MKAKIQFQTMFEQLPKKVACSLKYKYRNKLLSLSLINFTLNNSNSLGEEIISQMGFEDQE